MVGYGAGLATLQTMRNVNFKLDYIVDDSKEIQGQYLLDIPIKSPDYLMHFSKGSIFIIVFIYNNKALLTIQEKLSSWGFDYYQDWIDCSLLHFTTIKKRLQHELNIQVDPDLFVRSRILSMYSPIKNLSSIAGTWLFEELLKKVCCSMQGNIAELGVYQGGNAFISNFLLWKTLQGRKYYLFDSFEGFPEFSFYDPQSRSDEFSDVSFSYVKNLFSAFKNIRIYRGLFSDTFKKVTSESFVFVYIDCDLYQPTLESCRFFYDRIKKGGIMLFHDYCGDEPDLPQGSKKPFTGVKKAVDEFFLDRTESIIEFPETTHALIVKL